MFLELLKRYFISNGHSFEHQLDPSCLYPFMIVLNGFQVKSICCVRSGNSGEDRRASDDRRCQTAKLLHIKHHIVPFLKREDDTVWIICLKEA